MRPVQAPQNGRAHEQRPIQSRRAPAVERSSSVRAGEQNKPYPVSSTRKSPEGRSSGSCKLNLHTFGQSITSSSRQFPSSPQNSTNKSRSSLVLALCVVATRTEPSPSPKYSASSAAHANEGALLSRTRERAEWLQGARAARARRGVDRALHGHEPVGPAPPTPSPASSRASS